MDCNKIICDCFICNPINDMKDRIFLEELKKYDNEIIMEFIQNKEFDNTEK